MQPDFAARARQEFPYPAPNDDLTGCAPTRQDWDTPTSKPKDLHMDLHMENLSFRSLLLLPALLTLAACDETATYASGGDAESALEQRGVRNCLRAVKKHTGGPVAANTTIPVVEVNQYVIDGPGDKSWRCFTDDAGQPQQLIEVRAG